MAKKKKNIMIVELITKHLVVANNPIEAKQKVKEDKNWVIMGNSYGKIRKPLPGEITEDDIEWTLEYDEEKKENN